MISFEIDGQIVRAKKNETILQVARREGFYIPTMCYLTKVKPIASCRICVVEVEDMDGFALSCQERATEGMKITTNSDELYKYRQNIMKLYNVNHPLECGVCDKSGECDLQNKTMEFGVGTQTFTVRDQKRGIQDWNLIQYDPALCIMCEKCVHVCNEVIGDDAIEIKYGGYNSEIIVKGADTLDCTFCGECIAVCPVGALISSDFKYTSNAWELKSIPASCAHCSSACHLYYDIKDNEPFRVKNEFEFNTLCGAGRFAYNFQNKGSNSKEDLEKAVSAFKEADTIRFDSVITNEEALILQKLKEKYGYKLLNDDALHYKKFMQAFSKVSGSNLYSGDLKSIQDSDFIMVLGSRIATDNPVVRYKVTQASKNKKAEVIYMHPIEDDLLTNVVTQLMKYEVGSEEGVLALVASELLKNTEIPNEIKTVLDALDEGYVSAESNIGEEEVALMSKKMSRKKHFSLIAGSDLYAHPRAENIAKLLGIIEKYSDIEVVIVPPSTNTLGVSLICDLDETAGEKTIGYNADGEFILSSREDQGDINMPALNQQEGTLTNIDKRVVPTNAAVSFNGFCLNDIANKLGLTKEYTVDYTKELPVESGFKNQEFDTLPNSYDMQGNENRGYLLDVIEPDVENSLEEIDEINSYDGIVVYQCDPVLQFNNYTAVTNIDSNNDLLGSKQFSTAAKVSDGDIVKVIFKNLEIEKTFKLGEDLKGTIALMPTFDLSVADKSLFSNYRYSKVKITQVAK